MIIDSEFRLESDVDNWILIQKVPKTNNQTKEVVLRDKKSYYHSLDQALGGYVNQSLKGCAELSNIRHRLIDLRKVVEQIKDELTCTS